MSKPVPATPMLDQSESGHRPSFINGLKRLVEWKGGTIGIFSHGAGVIARFFQIANKSVLACRAIEPCPTGFGETAHAPRPAGASNL